MSGFKDPSYLDRKSAATDAKKAALEKFRARLSGNGPAAEPAAKSANAVPAAGNAPETKAAKTLSPVAEAQGNLKAKTIESKPAKSRGK